MAQLIEFSINHWVLVTLFFAILTLLIGSEVSRQLSGIVEISPYEATQKLNHDKATLLDIRESREFTEEHILNSLNIPKKDLNSRMQELESAKNKPVIVYCANGHRATSACTLLHKNGFQSVFNLKGGLTAWRVANLPIGVRKDG